MKCSLCFRILFLILIFGSATPLYAADSRTDEFEEFQSEEDLEGAAGKHTESAPVQKDVPKKEARGSSNAKEAEGSKAPNRFEAGIVNKSHYRINGEPLEVDPD